ncbi:MAG: arginase [Proteobacteria bacterium]|nr:arginase [Pseudomonadota bacterium]
MQLCLLHVDEALESQQDFIYACDKAGAHQIRLQQSASDIRLWGTWAGLNAFHEIIRRQWHANDEPRLCFMGSGDFHHVTAFLAAQALERHKGPITLIHFDNHPDWVHFEKGTHCGSWVNRALQHSQVKKVITIGVCSHDLRLPEWKGANLPLLTQGVLELYPYAHAPSRVKKNYGVSMSFDQQERHLHWKTIQNMGEQHFTDFLLSRIKTDAVYMTIDKDVLAREDAITNWDQGRMRLPYLLSLIKAIGNKHRIIGADVTGDYSTPVYSGSLMTRLSKRAEIFMDQPHSRVNTGESISINSAANHALLNVFSEAMA